MNDIKRYFELIHQKRTELRAIAYRMGSKNKIETYITSTKEIEDYKDFFSFCEEWDNKANLYAGIHERIPGGTKSSEVVCIKIIALDIDSKHPINEAATEKELEICKQETFQMVEELAKDYGRPSILMTGNGYQLLWKIRPINLNEKNRELTEQKLQQWIRTIQKKYTTQNISIDQIGDLARILKIAGTMSVKGLNTKQRPHRKTYFVEYNNNLSDNIRDEILTTSIQPQTNQLSSMIKPKKGRLGKFDYILGKDQKLARLYDGNIVNYKSRSEAELALVCKLVYYEFSDEELDLIMRNSKIGKWNTSKSAYKELTISKARLLIREKKDDLKDIKLEDVYNVLSKWLYIKDFLMIDLMLAIVLSQRLVGNPLWFIFVGPSGDGKSEMARMIEHLDFIYKVDQITPNTIVSGNPKVEDLAPNLNNKLLLITDFASILSLNGDSQKSIFAQLRNLYDGDAYKDSGAGARKHYTGLRITLIANSTPQINHKILIHQDLGTRELMYRTDFDESMDDFDKKSLRALENSERKDEMRKEIQGVVSAYLNNVQVVNGDLTEGVKSWLLGKAKWLSLMRSTCAVDCYSGDLISNVSPEVPTRLLLQLKCIYNCLKSLNPDYPEERVRELILRIINSSAKEIRVKIFQYLEGCKEGVSTSQISEALRLGKKTVLTECNILWNLHLIHCDKIRTEQFGREFEISRWYKKKEKEEVLTEVVK